MVIFYNQKWLLIKDSALTLKPFIFLSDSRRGIFEQPWKLRHEECHYKQQLRCGLFRFLFIWLRDLFSNYWSGMSWVQAYMKIPFEIEARDSEGTNGI